MSFSLYTSVEIWHRGDFPILCNWRKLYRCAEIGVDRGEFAAMFLDRFPLCCEYWGIDAYEPYPEMPYDRHADYLMAVQRLERHASRARLVKLASMEAAKLFPPGTLDFIYIDGAHDRLSVTQDLLTWWPIVSRQGILAGHDFDDTHPGVMEAVMDFAGTRDLKVYLTNVQGYGQDACQSWYIYKSGMPGPDWRRC